MNTYNIDFFQQFKGLIFDCDGTLVDTMPAHYKAWSETMWKYGIHFEEKRFYELGGVPTIKIIEMLANEAGKTIDIPSVAMEKDEAFNKYHDTIGRVEKITKIAEAYRGKLPMAVATGSTYAVAMASLEKTGIADWFEAVLAADQTPNPKPAPDVFLLAAQSINIAPRDCCAFEDTDIGLQAIDAAQMTAIDVRQLIKKT